MFLTVLNVNFNETFRADIHLYFKYFKLIVFNNKNAKQKYFLWFKTTGHLLWIF